MKLFSVQSLMTSSIRICCVCPFLKIVLTVFVLMLRISCIGTTSQKEAFSTIEICLIANRTVEIVGSCPSDDETLQKRLQRKKCHSYSSCQNDALTYHCVRYKNTLAEVCAPRGLITGGCCAVFEEGLGRVVEDYFEKCERCPFQYYSNDTSMYSQCVTPPENTDIPEKGEENQKNFDDTSVERPSKLLNEQTTLCAGNNSPPRNVIVVGTYNDSEADVKLEKSEKLGNGNEAEDETVIIIVIVTAISALCLCLMALFVYSFKKWKEGRALIDHKKSKYSTCVKQEQMDNTDGAEDTCIV